MKLRSEKMRGKRIGYKRVSSFDQSPLRQLVQYELDKEFIDYCSAKSMDRPKLQLMLDYVREDDIVYVHSMDRLARNVKDLRAIVDTLVEKKVQVHFEKEHLFFNGEDSAMSNLLLSVMGAFAEFELAFIRERQLEGIAIAKAKGTYKGGVKKLSVEKTNWLKCQLLTTRRTKSDLAKELGISRVGLYNYIRDFQKEDSEVLAK